MESHPCEWRRPAGASECEGSRKEAIVSTIASITRRRRSGAGVKGDGPQGRRSVREAEGVELAQEFVEVRRDGRVAIVSLDRIEAHNALSGAMADELSGAFKEVAADDGAWVLLLRANGDKAFCVGADLRERESFTLEDFNTNRKQIRGMFEALRAVPQPVVAAPFGFALGGGMELVLSADIVVAADSTVFGLPEARVGLLPAGGGTQLLARKVGLARAKDLIFRGRRFTAEEGLAMGLIAQVAPAEELDATALDVARDVCRSSPVALRETKRAMDATYGVGLEDGIELENDAWKVVIATEDRAEGIAAFNEKRDPEWKGR
jgi:enoyl-CoA hydratase/carnithine racemase